MIDPELDGNGCARRPVAIDLFSGAGGLSLGFESVGFDVLSAVEYDPVHAATHLYNFPMTDVLCRDVTTLTGDDLIRSASVGWDLHYPDGPDWDGKVDVIFGGPSCQGFSSMGKQDVLDQRNQLVLQFVRLVEEVRPRAFCMENVPGLLQPQFRPLRDEALRRLREAGYLVTGENTVLRAEEFGVPQKRRRVMFLGSLESKAPPLPSPTHNIAPTVKEAFAGLPSFLLERQDSAETIKLSETQLASLDGVQSGYVREAGIRRNRPGSGGRERVVNFDELSGCLMTRHQAETVRRFSATKQGTKEPISRLYRLDEARPALTLRAGTGRERGAFSAARPLHPTEPRVVTVREAARLHTFPDWFRFHVTNWHAHRQIGNAVPPLLAAAAARSILESLGIGHTIQHAAPIEMGDPSLLRLNPTEAAARMKAVRDQVPPGRVRRASK